ncbi:MAG: C1 family peptidase [Syntrophomonas sp.]
MSFESVYRIRRMMEDLKKEHNGYPLKCIPSSYDPRDYKYLKLLGAVGDEKAVAIDYRRKMPPVFDQGQRGSCVACAGTWTLKAYEEIQQGDYPADGFSAAFLYTMCKQNDGAPDEEGTTPRTAMKMLKKYGVCSEDIMPYSTLENLAAPQVPSVSGVAMGEAVAFRIQTYAQICSASDLSRDEVLTAMRQALAKEGPFIIALLVCENFEPDANNKLPLPKGEVRGGHAVGIVGDLPEQESLILRNSWGSGWGDNGYALLPYEWITSHYAGEWSIFEAWTATDIAVSKRAGKIEIKPGLYYIVVDGVKVGIDQPALTSRASRILIPVRAAAESMGYKVDWDGRKAVLTRQD